MSICDLPEGSADRLSLSTKKDGDRDVPLLLRTRDLSSRMGSLSDGVLKVVKRGITRPFVLY